MRSTSFQLLVLTVGSALIACSAAESGAPDFNRGGNSSDKGGSGNNNGKGGNANPGNGGTGNGGSANGGTSNGGTGTGGTGSGKGGAASGGSSSGGTNNGNGGTTSGGKSSGGASSGGTGSGGKTTGAGGTGSGGTSSGGKTGSGGTAAGGTGSGGKIGAGGTTTGMGGTGMGGATTGMGGVTSTCTEAQKVLTANAIGQHCGYTYEYWKDSGSGSLTVKPDGFGINWSNIGNLLGRKGIRPGSANLVVTYDATYSPNGNSYLCIYGWTKSPLVEYYIVESYGTWRPPGSMASMGTVSSDGGTYDIYRTQRVQQPSIEGTQTFYQYWSVRTAKRTSGTITVGNHFTAWASKGMNMGSFYEVSMTVEGYQSSGTADVKMSIK